MKVSFSSNGQLTTSELVKVLELLVVRATAEVKTTLAETENCKDNSPFQQALTARVQAHAAGRLAGLERALKVAQGTWVGDAVLAEAVKDIVGDFRVLSLV